MSTMWPLLMFAYVFVAAACFVAGVLNYSDPITGNRRTGAVLMLVAPIWPLAAICALPKVFRVALGVDQ